METKKVVEIYSTKSSLSKLILAAKSDTCKEWEDRQEEICKGMGLNREVRLMERLGRIFGINPIEYDNEPFGVFIDTIWVEAQNYTLYNHSDSTVGMKVNNASEYLKNKIIVEPNPYIFSKESRDYIPGNGLVPEKDFINRFPLELIRANYKGENPDHTKVV